MPPFDPVADAAASRRRRQVEVVQFVGVVLLAALTIGARVVSSFDVMSLWLLYVVWAGAMMLVFVIGAAVFSRIERIPLRAVAGRVWRSTRDDVCAQVKRVRRLLRR